MKIEIGLCQCGCGQETELAQKTLKARGWIKGQPKRFIHGHNSKGTSNPNWNGGRWFDGRYFRINVRPNHPFISMCNDHGGAYWTYEHRMVLAEKIGRPLNINEDTHHIDGNPTNNHPDNLELMALGHHQSFHTKQKVQKGIQGFRADVPVEEDK